MPKAIHAQEFGAGYNYGGLRELRNRQRAGQRFNSFNMEQQGQILGDYYIDRNDPSTTARALQTYEHFVADVRS